MQKNNIHYIFVSGGVLSGLGKGLTTSSIALLLQQRGYNVVPIKSENYLNIDAGTINPIEHGDPFLCEDGLEADIDLGNYERFLNKEMSWGNFITMGQIYKTIIDKERNMGYEGKTVDPIPHVPEEIIRRIKDTANKQKAEIVVIELGGTAGEYQNIFYYEAARMMKHREGDNVLHVHVSYVPVPNHIGEPKTKPTQLSVQTLNSMGIQPDFIIARSEVTLDDLRKEKLANSCYLDKKDIISNPNLAYIEEIPLELHRQNLDTRILDKLNLPHNKLDLTKWNKTLENIKSTKKSEITISIVGKYFATGDHVLKDSYYALIEAINHASWRNHQKVNFKWVNSEVHEKEMDQVLKGSDGIIVPIGWGSRGVEGKINAIKYARENKVPYLGLCYGMQLAAVEFARNVVGLKGANTAEVDPKTEYPIIHQIPETSKYQTIKGEGVSMRLGGYDCILDKKSLVYEIYNKHNAFKDTDKAMVSERHRHRYEFNNKYREMLSEKGLRFSGTSPDNFFVEFIELPKTIHPFFIATQAHPEYKSSPVKPHPLFLEFLKEAEKTQ